MRSLELVGALVLAALVFIILKLLGLLMQFALIAAVLGFGAALLLARLFRSRNR